jgi:hypothetical protein
MDFYRVNVFHITKLKSPNTSKSTGLMIIVFFFFIKCCDTQWLGKHWEHGRESEGNPQPSKTSSQLHVRAGCTDSPYVKNEAHEITHKKLYLNSMPSIL